MRISMWVLADRLKKYERTIQIEEGKRILRNARIFSDGLRLSGSTVYVSQPQPGRVLCSNGADCIILCADDVNDVFNDILDIFEDCNNASGEAYDMVASGCGAKDLLEKGAALLGRALILADATFYMREIADFNGYLRRQTDGWNAEDRMLSLDALLSISALPQIRVAGLPSYPLAPEGADRPAVVTNLFVRGRQQGWLISVGGPEPPHRGALDLQDGFGEIVTAWLERRDQETAQMEQAGLFPRLLEQGPEGCAAAERRLRTFGWYPEDLKQVYAIGQLSAGPDQTPLLERQLEKLSANTFAFRTGERLYYIIDRALTPPQQIEQRLREILARCGCAAGTSAAFTALEQLSDCCSTADIALRFAGRSPGGIVDFADAVLPYAAQLLRERSGAALRHPALAVLEKYDSSHDGSLKETLAEFLNRECSVTAAARALYIHRSTLLYRLQRIRDLTGLDPEDPRTRLHLRISLLMDQSNAP